MAYLSPVLALPQADRWSVTELGLDHRSLNIQHNHICLHIDPWVNSLGKDKPAVHNGNYTLLRANLQKA